MHVLDVNPTSGLTRAGTIMGIPFDSIKSPYYLILLDDSTTRSVPTANMESLIQKTERQHDRLESPPSTLPPAQTNDHT
jgi:hypothetical protein